MIRVALLALAMLSSPQESSAQSGGLRVSPIVLEMADGARTTFFRVQNAGARARAFEICLMRWAQSDGADVLTPVNDVIVSPSVFELPAGRTQIVRAALAPGVGQSDTELTYRFLLRELALEDAPASQGLRLRLEISLPLFVRGRLGTAEQLTARRIGGDIEIENAGPAHARLSAIDIGGRPLDGAPRYLLAGASFRRPSPGPGVVRARVARDDAGVVDLTLADAAPRPRAR